MTARVERLLRLADSPDTAGATVVVNRDRARLVWSGLAFVTIAGVAFIDYEITEATHAAIEHFVATLR